MSLPGLVLVGSCRGGIGLSPASPAAGPVGFRSAAGSSPITNAVESNAWQSGDWACYLAGPTPVWKTQGPLWTLELSWLWATHSSSDCRPDGERRR